MAAVKDTAYPGSKGPALRYAAVALAFASELIHLRLVPGQLVAAMLPAIFFLLVAVGQGILATSLLFGFGRWAIRLGLLLNLSVIFVWVLTGLVSVPELFEPLRLPFENLGLLATVTEVALVLVLVKLRKSLSPKKKHDRHVR